MEKNITTLEESIHDSEANLLSLEESLCTPEIYNDGIKANEVKNKIEEIKLIIENYYIDWENLHDEINNLKSEDD